MSYPGRGPGAARAALRPLGRRSRAAVPRARPGRLVPELLQPRRPERPEPRRRARARRRGGTIPVAATRRSACLTWAARASRSRPSAEPDRSAWRGSTSLRRDSTPPTGRRRSTPGTSTATRRSSPAGREPAGRREPVRPHPGAGPRPRPLRPRGVGAGLPRRPAAGRGGGAHGAGQPARLGHSPERLPRSQGEAAAVARPVPVSGFLDDLAAARAARRDAGRHVRRDGPNAADLADQRRREERLGRGVHRRAGITGATSSRASSPAAGSGAARSSARPTATAACRSPRRSRRPTWRRRSSGRLGIEPRRRVPRHRRAVPTGSTWGALSPGCSASERRRREGGIWHGAHRGLDARSAAH